MSGRNTLTRAVGGAAATKVVVMGLSGLLGIFTSKLIIGHFGTAAYAQYGLLSTITSLLPFADLGMAAVLINTIAGSRSPERDPHVRRTMTTAFRVLLGSAAVITAAGAAIGLAGLWPVLLGGGLMSDAGSLVSFLCVLVFALALPLGVGGRALVGLGRNTTQLALQAVVAPFIFAVVGAAVLFGIPLGDYLAVVSYAANALASLLCLLVAARLLRPQVGRALIDVPHLRHVPGVPVMGTAWPMLVQMLSLPIAMQTDRLLLSHLTHGAQLAQYNLASQLFGLVIQTVSAAGMALWPIYARARAESEVRSPAGPTFAFASGGLALAALIAVLSPFLTHFIAGGRFTLDPWLVGGFVVFALLQAAKYPIGMYMTDRAGLRFQVAPILVMVPLNLGVSWWLTLVIGAGGPIIGSAVSVLVCQVVPNFLYVRHDLRRRSAAVDAARSAPHDDDRTAVGAP